MPDQTPLTPLRDYPAPLNRANMTTALCNSLGAAFVAIQGPLSPEVTVERLRMYLSDAARAAQVLGALDGRPSAVQFMTARALEAGAELCSEVSLADFRAEGERRAALGLDPVTGRAVGEGEDCPPTARPELS